MRALEQDLHWTFPAIKKQIDSMNDAWIVEILKTQAKRSIEIKPEVKDILTQMMILALKLDIQKLIDSYPTIIYKVYRWRVFGKIIEPDIVILHRSNEWQFVEQIKQDLSKIFEGYFVNAVLAVFMSESEFEKRQKYADKFVLSILRSESLGR